MCIRDRHPFQFRFPVLFPVAPAPGFNYTHTTYFPDADPETNTVDGMVRRSAVDEAFGTVRSGAGTVVQDDLVNANVIINTSGTTNQFEQIARGMALFNTADIADTDTIDSATCGFTAGGSFTGLVVSMSLTTSSPASNTSIATGDYADEVTNDMVKQATDIAVSSWDVGGVNYNTYTLNATGLGNISVTGISKFGIKVANDVDNSAPTWGASLAGGITVQFAEQTGTAKDPKLVVTHSAAAVILGGIGYFGGGVTHF